MTEQTEDPTVEPDVLSSDDYTGLSTPVNNEPETFDREYVQKLRDEAAGHRVKAKRADALAASLVTAQAALTGKLADPTDLPFDEALLDEDGYVDESKVQAADAAVKKLSVGVSREQVLEDLGYSPVQIERMTGTPVPATVRQIA